MANKKVQLNIAGLDYMITTDDDPEYMRMLGEEINQKILRMLRDNAALSVTMAATMVALEYGDAYSKSESNADNLRKQIKQYLEDAAHVRAELDVVKRENNRLSQQVVDLRSRQPGRDSR